MLTMIVMSCEILFINEQIVIPVQLPKFAVNNVEMLVTKILSNLVNIFLFFKKLDNAE